MRYECYGRAIGLGEDFSEKHLHVRTSIIGPRDKE